jgi:hypothetical protein
MAQPQFEQRARRRFALRLPVAVLDSQRGEFTAHTRDVSSRGICFSIDRPMAAGSDLQLTLTLPREITLTQPIRMRCFGRVVRVDPAHGIESIVAAEIHGYEFLAEAI